MGKINFEEYRQPWETGPHWELKREFLERFQDVFTEDRLLCLAQAYANIELLHCSYPSEVMIQVNELAKSLKEGKGLKRNSNQGKRSGSDLETPKKFKFIKFCSSKDATEEKLEEEVEANLPTDVATVPTENAEPKPAEDIQESVLIEKLASQVQKLVSTQVRNELGEVKTKKVLQWTKKQNAMDLIQSAALLLRMKSLVQVRITTRPDHDSVAVLNKYVCEIIVGGTLLATGDGTSEDIAKDRTSQMAIFTLMNFHNLPTKNISDVGNENNIASEEMEEESEEGFTGENALNSSKLSKVDVQYLKEFVQELKISMNKNKSPMVLIPKTLTRMNRLDDLLFHVVEDVNTPIHNRIFTCDFILKNILIAQGKCSSIKKSRSKAAALGIKNLFEFQELNETQGSTSRKSSETETFFKNLKPAGEANKSDSSSTETTSGEGRSSVSINRALLDNSLRKEFVLIDRVQISSLSGTTPGSIVSISASTSRKLFKYELEAQGNNTTKASVIIGKDIVSTALAQSKDEAKKLAAKLALEKLRKEYYTVKIKTDDEEGHIINRSGMVECIGKSDALTDDNLGFKMLKNMGWSGGGINEKGIAEPVTAQDCSRGHGLGYNNTGSNAITTQKLRQEMNILLKKFSESGSMGALLFTPDFSVEERKQIHNIARKYNLTSNSYGTGEARQLCIKRKVSVRELLDMIVKAGGSTYKYELVDMSTTTD